MRGRLFKVFFFFFFASFRLCPQVHLSKRRSEKYKMKIRRGDCRRQSPLRGCYPATGGAVMRKIASHVSLRHGGTHTKKKDFKQSSVTQRRMGSCCERRLLFTASLRVDESNHVPFFVPFLFLHLLFVLHPDQGMSLPNACTNSMTNS